MAELLKVVWIFINASSNSQNLGIQLVDDENPNKDIDADAWVVMCYVNKYIDAYCWPLLNYRIFSNNSPRMFMRDGHTIREENTVLIFG